MPHCSCCKPCTACEQRSGRGEEPAVCHRLGVEPLPRHDVRATLEEIVQGPPFAGNVRIDRVETIGRARPQAVVCVPAHRERDHVAAMIEAWVRAVEYATKACGLVIVVNNSPDGTFEAAMHAALQTARRFGASHTIALVEATLSAKYANVGYARRLALDLGAAIEGVDVLLSTDADTVVAVDWIERASSALIVHDLVCGHTDVDPAELAALPPSVAACGQAEAELEASLNALWWSITGHSARGFANRGAGANMGMRADAYREVGGLPVLRSGEDRALHALFERHGKSISHEAAMRVRTSCRLDERAEGGMAGCLGQRAGDADPPVDSELMPARTLLRRAVLHRVLFGTAGAGGEALARAHWVATAIGTSVDAIWRGRAAPRETWNRLIATLSSLRCGKLRTSQARHEARVAAWMHGWIIAGVPPLAFLTSLGSSCVTDACLADAAPSAEQLPTQGTPPNAAGGELHA